MGLDMYLEKCSRKVWGYKDMNIDKMKANNPALYEELKPFIIERGTNFHWESFFTEVGYWRKANAIHKWFVDNVQNEVDDCGTYEVSKEQLEALLGICLEVKNSIRMEKGLIKNGDRLVNGVWEPIMEEGEYIANPEIAEELLPTQSGFFFGGTEYDEWYLEDIKDTINILENVLASTDFDREIISYSSSW